MLASQQELNDIGTAIVTAAIRVHRITGPGLLESCYREALAYELSDEGLYVQQLVKVPFVYRGKPLGHAFEMDLLVENLVVVEIKSVAELHPVHMAQLLTYLKLSDLSLGYIINFNVTLLKEGLKRVVHHF